MSDCSQSDDTIFDLLIFVIDLHLHLSDFQELKSSLKQS